jgi:hypothetical protein
MKPLRLCLIALLLAGAQRATAQQGSFGAPAMLPLPADLAPYQAGGYAQPSYPPGLGGYDDPALYYGGMIGAAPPAPQPVHPARYAYAPPAPAIPAPEPVLPAPTDRALAPRESPSGDAFADALGSPCGSCNSCNNCCRPAWFGAIGALVMTRNNPNPVWTSALVDNNFNQVMNTVDANTGWAAGGEVRLGRQLCCGQAWEFTWWTIAPLTGYASYSDPGNLLTPINLFGVDIGGVPAETYFDNADEHRIWRRDTFQNVELNWYSIPLSMSYKPCTLTWLCGLRYFQFNEGLVFGSVEGGYEFGEDGGRHEAYINSQVRNRLFGPQVGVIANYFVRPRLSLFAVPKFGIYNNWVHEDFQVYRGDGVNAYTVRENQNFLAFVSQFDLGANWAITPRCSIFGGYRVLIANGVALADNQIPNYLIDTPDIRDIKPNGNLILHGAMLGVQFIY